MGGTQAVALRAPGAGATPSLTKAQDTGLECRRWLPSPKRSIPAAIRHLAIVFWDIGAFAPMTTSCAALTPLRCQILLVCFPLCWQLPRQAILTATISSRGPAWNWLD